MDKRSNDGDGGDGMTDWLYFSGRWGDARWEKSDKRQDSLVGLAYKYEGGPTGPAFKNLARKDVWDGSNKRVLTKLGP